MRWATKVRNMIGLGGLAIAFGNTLIGGPAGFAQTQPARDVVEGRLPQERGDQLIDFSHCGYAGADRNIPDVPVRETIAPGEGDDGQRIQSALDFVAGLPIGADGFRGAVLLAPGQFEVAGHLEIKASGVVLRGSGAGENGTVLVATGHNRRALISVAGVDDLGLRQKNGIVIDEYVPVGSRKINVSSVAGFRVGDPVLVTRPSTKEWIHELGMEVFGVGWRPGSRDIRWDRIVTAIDGNQITLDAPITTAIEKRFGSATIAPYDWRGRIENVGIEDLRLVSEYAQENPKDEEHAWFGVTMNDVQNAWVRRVEFRHFAGGAVALWENTKWVTVEDCIALAPVSELGGYRRHTFFNQGQLALFLRCWSEQGLHDFSLGHCAAGPNAFVNCCASEAKGDSGPLESWASGVLYDNVRIDGANLNLINRWMTPPAAGWSAANCVVWQCQAAIVQCFKPPTANNWAMGIWASVAGDGSIQGVSDFVGPISLNHAQLKERRGAAAAAHIELGLVDPIGSTNPSLQEAAQFVAQSNRPARQLIDVIRERIKIPLPPGERFGEGQNLRVAPPSPNASSPQQVPGDLKGTGTSIVDQPAKPLSIENGWLVVDGKLKTGGLIGQGFWRGNIRPDDAPNFGPAITRFVPGRVGTGFTDDLEHVADEMAARNAAVFDHHYGLWYDRRRDDHLMVRRGDGEVAPPFYEQPFARTGKGKAWDGLSKYDLTKFNPWYWNRLHDFAQLCDQRGMVLIHQNYFQHNILEAGAHWADSPWRPANNVNDMGLPEPPPYVGDKRIFLAQQFYDVSDPRRRDLHRNYIRRCADYLADCQNVIQMTSAEYSGPLEFTQFWIDTIIEWEKERQGAGSMEHGERHSDSPLPAPRSLLPAPGDVLIGLSVPKDVQDAILEDPQRGPHVDVIDIRYWAYTAGGELYAPDGGQNLAPRQHLRKARQKSGGFGAIVRAVRQYRTKYPDKAVTYYADMHCPSGRDGWAVLMGGGSLPNVKLPPELAGAIPSMRPMEGIVSGEDQWCLASDNGDYLIYTEETGGPIDVNLPSDSANYRVQWIDARSGQMTSGEEVSALKPLHLKPVKNVIWITRMGQK